MESQGDPFEDDGDAGFENDNEESDNLRAMLEQKDRDLMLAAELGKALLEKNSDLEKKLEHANEEYSQSIEVCSR